MKIGVSLRQAPKEYADGALHSSLVDFVEIAAEEFTFRNDSIAQSRLKQITDKKPVSVHSYSLSLLDPRPWNELHIKNYFNFIRSYNFIAASDHYAISSWTGQHLGSLTPAPTGKEANQLLKERLEIIKKEIPHIPFLIENVAVHLYDALSGTHAKLLLDLSNLVANEINFGVSAEDELDRLKGLEIAEIHLAGGHWDNGFYLDSHSSPTTKRSWELLSKIAPRLSKESLILIEREQSHPSWETIEREIEYAASICKL